MVIFNFRADRVIELSKALEYRDFDKFDRRRWPDVSCHSAALLAGTLHVMHCTLDITGLSHVCTIPRSLVLSPDR